MEVCATPLWDTSLTWLTNNPDFTPCFHQTILVMVPAVFILLLSPLQFYLQCSSQTRSIPWCVRNITRILANGVLIVLSVLELGLTLTSEKQLYISDILAPVVDCVGLLMVLVISLINIRRGQHSSAILFGFWALKAVCMTLTFASVIRFGADLGQVINSSVFLAEYSVSVSLFFLHFWADPEAKEKSVLLQSEKPSPELSSSFPNRIMFSWFGSILSKGWRNPITVNDLYDLNPSERSSVIFSDWEKQWEKCDEKNAPNTPVSILGPIFFTFGLAYLGSSFIQLLSVLLTQISPQALNLLIAFISSEEEMWKGYLYMVYLVGINVLVTLLNSQYFLEQMLIGLRMRAAFTSALFRKSFKLTSKTRKERSVGESVNLMQIDSQKLMDVIQNLNLIWSSPLTIFLSIYSLWGYLGPSCLAGLLVMVLLIPTNAVLGSTMKRYQRENMKFKDNRMKAMNEILDGMKVLKLYAWEPSFQEQVEGIRATEVTNLKKLSYLQAFQKFLFTATPFFVALASFGTYVLVDSNNILDAQKAFVSLTYFNIIRGPLTSLPSLAIQMIQAQVSLDRLNKFLNASEINPNNVSHDDEGDTVLRIKNGTFTWDEELVPVLNNINLKVERRQLIAVVGQVGSGKSSLLSAITNDLVPGVPNAEINVNGSLSYVPQQAWMQNASLQYNITFGSDYDEKMYNKVLDACALRPDLEILPNGDQTEIGEKGINLSGGQKQRVSLARSVYNNGDIYLLDDPLSAVDAHVGQHLFEKVIGPSGLLKNKTRVLVTHGVKYLPIVDKIVVLKNGSVSEVGTYRELLDGGREFADFLVQYIQEEEDKILESQDSDAIQLVKGDLIQKMGETKLKKEIEKSRSNSSVTAFSRISAYRKFKSQKSYKDNDLNENSSLIVPNKSKDTNMYGATKQKTGITTKQRKEQENAGKLMTEEKVETKAVDNAVYSFYFRAVGLKVAFNIIFLNILTQGFTIGTNIWLSAWSDDPRSAEVAVRNKYLSVYGVLGALSAIAICLATLATAVGGLNASTRLHDNMLRGVLRAPMSFFDTNPKGRIVNRFAKDIDYVDGSIPLTFSALLRLGLGVLGTVFVICTTLPIFLALILPISAMYWFVQKFYIATSRQFKRLESSTRSPIYSWFGEAVSGVATVKAYGLQDQFCNEMNRKVDLNSMTMEPNFIANRWLSIRLELLGNLIILFAALLSVIGRNTLEPGIVGLSLSYAMQITQNLNLLIRQTSQIENNMVSVERIKEYQNQLPKEAEWSLASDPGDTEWPRNGDITFDNLQVRYREGLPLVLKGVSLGITGGEKVGIVGRTGSGKSSLTLSIFRINEAAAGSITIDSRDIANIGLGTLRSSLTIIPQDPVLFSGSLRMNLDPFNKSNTHDLWRALELAHLKSYVSSLPGGLDHLVSEGGDNLSVGQRQLLCLARACLRKTKILLLDEATAAVDLETDDLIQATIRSEFHDCTIITIAHRLNTIMDSDKVVVLSDGHLAECDTPQNLLGREDSVFHSMAKEAGLVKH